MDDSEKIETLRKIQDVASLGGIKSKLDETRQTLEAVFSLPNNRTQLVLVRVSGRSLSEQVIATVFSPCHSQKTGFLQGISKNTALEMLKQNEKMLFGRYGIVSMDGSDLVVVSVDRAVDSLDHKELNNIFWYVATYADEFERTHSKEDKF